jgi:lysophospholipase L1-like esterase
MCPWSLNAVSAVVNQQSNSFSGAWYLTANGSGYVTLPATLRTAGEWIIIKTVINGANSSLSINGDPAATAAGNIGTSTSASVRILGSYVIGSNYCNTAVKAHLEFPGVVSSTNDAAIMAWLNSRYVKTSQLFCDGSSITANAPSANADWPSQILALLRGNWTVHNVAVAGQNLAAMASDAATQIDAKINSLAAYKIAVAEAPTNSIYQITAGSISGTAASLYADYRAYCLARRAAGFLVITTTVMPRTDVTTPGGFEAMRLDFNTRVRAGASTFSDALVDIAADPRFQNANDTTYFGDKIHPTPAGLAIWAQLIALAINRLTDTTGGSGLGQLPLDIPGNAASATALATSRTIGITGDLTYTSPAFDGSANVTAAATLATTGVTATTYGGTSAIPVITVDAKGRITSASNATPTYSASSLTGSTLASGVTASSLISAAGGNFATGAYTAAYAPAGYLAESLTTHTIALAEASCTGSAGVIIDLTHTSGCAITIPTNATIAFPVGSEIPFIRATGAGVPTASPAGGVTLRNSAALALIPAEGAFLLKKLATNTWIVI